METTSQRKYLKEKKWKSKNQNQKVYGHYPQME